MTLGLGPPKLREIEHHSYNMYPYNCIGIVIGNLAGSKTIATGNLLSSNLVLVTAKTIASINKEPKGSKLRKIKPSELVFYSQICGKLDPAKLSKIADYRLC